jgi:hypothetical protein
MQCSLCKRRREAERRCRLGWALAGGHGASALLGAQAAQFAWRGVAARASRGQSGRAGYLSSRQPDKGGRSDSGLRAAVGRCVPAAGHAVLRDLPELLAFFQCPRSLWRKLQTTDVIERCFVEVCRRPPDDVFCERAERERMFFSIFRRQHTLREDIQAA